MWVKENGSWLWRWQRLNYLSARLLVAMVDRVGLWIIAAMLLPVVGLHTGLMIHLPLVRIFGAIDSRLSGLDTVAVLAAFAAVGYPLVVTIVLWLVYLLISLWWKGRTLGMVSFDLVYTTAEGAPPSWRRLALCYVLSMFTALSVVGMFWVLFDRRGTLPEVLSGIRVVCREETV